MGEEECLYLGNLNSLRDWGHAKDYVEMQWLMLQQDNPKDYVIATGRQISVREFLILSFRTLGIEIDFQGKGKNETGVIASINPSVKTHLSVGDTILKIDERYYRPTEVETLLGDSSKAAKELGWKPKISIEELVKEMMEADLEIAKRNKKLKHY